jgi:nucleoside-diphosphate-sugar epimerase
MVKVMVLGATGTIGRAVVETLSSRHEVIQVRHKDGAYRVDVGSPDSIKKLYETIGPVNAVVSPPAWRNSRRSINSPRRIFC